MAKDRSFFANVLTNKTRTENGCYAVCVGADGESGIAEESVPLFTIQTPTENCGRTGRERPEVETNPGQ